jgi:prepilin-type processing-associated H-X9-DG protein
VRSTDKERKLVRCSRPLILTSVVTVAALSLLAAGCGGGGSRGVARIASPTTASTTAATTTVQTGSLAGALAFARCMRSHGIPNWPDPSSDGRFDKSKLRQLDLSVSRVREIEGRSCNYVFLGGHARTITAADRADYLRAAACIRRHGFPDFPDPTFQNGTVTFNIPSSSGTDSPQAKSATATCGKLIPAGLPYSRSDGH